MTTTILFPGELALGLVAMGISAYHVHEVLQRLSFKLTVICKWLKIKVSFGSGIIKGRKPLDDQGGVTAPISPGLVRCRYSGFLIKHKASVKLSPGDQSRRAAQ